jgi:SAM-dependent methyltransferase
MAQGRPLLDRAAEEIADPSRLQSGMDNLVEGLRSLRRRVPSDSWEWFCRTVCVSHPVRYLVHQDPLTERSFFKPRGYPGDPVLLDFFYGGAPVSTQLAQATDLGKTLYGYTSTTRVARALRRRREILASIIDKVSAATEGARILTLDCGHLREAEICAALRDRKVDRFLALDRDPESLRVVQEKFGPLGVETAMCTVQELLEDPKGLGSFDLIYSAGLYDYLHRGLATRVTEALFKMTRSGGSLLVTNLVGGIRDVGYMEAFMDWKLEYRDANEMFGLTAVLPEQELADRRTFSEEGGGIVFMIVRRR